MTWFLSLLFLFSCGWLLVVAQVIRVDQHSVGAVESQVAYIGGKKAIVNREGCAEASGVCDFTSIGGGHGGGDCERFFQLTGKTVVEWCCENYKEGCYSGKPLPDGREGVGDR